MFLVVEGVKNKLVPLYSIVPASGVVKLVPEVNSNGAVPVAAVPAGKCNLAVGEDVNPILPPVAPDIKLPEASIVQTGVVDPTV